MGRWGGRCGSGCAGGSAFASRDWLGRSSGYAFADGIGGAVGSREAKERIMRLVLLPVWVCVLMAQAPDARVAFEVASVRHGRAGDYSTGGTGCPGEDPTRCFVENYPVSSLIELAYGIHSYQLSGPKWMEEERYTINAKAPEGSSRKQISLMLRNPLSERFQLATHFEKRETTGYELVVMKRGPKLDSSPGAPKQDEDARKEVPQIKTDREGYPEPPPGRHSWMAVDNDRARWKFVDESMDEFAGRIAEAMLQKPTVNATGLEGKYDFLLSYSWAAMQPDPPPDSGVTLFEAVQEQLGLKLEPRKVPVDTLVIDHIEKTPKTN